MSETKVNRDDIDRVAVPLLERVENINLDQYSIEDLQHIYEMLRQGKCAMDQQEYEEVILIIQSVNEFMDKVEQSNGNS